MKNIVIITLDDVSFYNLGFTNFYKNKSATPNIDKLANESYVFWNAHCNVPFCQPSRMVLLTGLYPQHNGSIGFNEIKSNIPTLSSILKNKNYYTSILGKVDHHKPDSSFNWDDSFRCKYKIEEKEIKHYLSLKKSPYFLLINIENTHRPFLSSEKIFEDEMPNFLSETKPMRQQLGNFFESLRRADEVVGIILNNLKSENDIVILTSDHGFSFPFIKGNCYGFSTNVPMIIKDKDIVKKHDKENVISHVDFMPTLSKILKFDGDFDGISYLELLRGDNKVESENYKYVYSQLNKMRDGPEFNIRSISDKSHTYCININKNIPFPGLFVDGWGWNETLSSMNKNDKDKFFKKQSEEFMKYDKMNYYECEDLPIKKRLKINLIKMMKKFNDPQFKNVISIL